MGASYLITTNSNNFLCDRDGVFLIPNDMRKEKLPPTKCMCHCGYSAKFINSILNQRMVM